MSTASWAVRSNTSGGVLVEAEHETALQRDAPVVERFHDPGVVVGGC